MQRRTTPFPIEYLDTLNFKKGDPQGNLLLRLLWQQTIFGAKTAAIFWCLHLGVFGKKSFSYSLMQ